MQEKLTIAMVIVCSDIPGILLTEIDKYTEETCLFGTVLKVHNFNDDSTIVEVVMSDGQSRYHLVW